MLKKRAHDKKITGHTRKTFTMSESEQKQQNYHPQT